MQLVLEDRGTSGTAAPEGSPDEATTLPVIGPYRLIRLLGEGGMGLVYLAEQTAPVQRQVALKVIKPGLASAHVLARFESERQALARLHHTGIASVFDAGTTAAGQPFFVMEYVDGLPITRYCDEHQLPIRARIELFLQVCAAVQHAHQSGIIHRDLKPANILVAQQDGRAIVKVIDFGVAKAIDQRLTERTAFTQQGILLGTPEYMSPEQAELSGVDVDARTDIYSLGLVLYELLVGVLPFDPEAMRRAGYLEILRIVREQESPRPTTRLHGLGKAASDIAHRRGTEARALARQLSGDLEWITLKALEKDRGRRYKSAAAFADDIARYVKDEPVLAGRPGAGYRLRKYLRRHRTAAAIGVAIATAALATAIAVWAVRRPAPPTPRRAVMPLTRDSGLTTDGVVSRDGKFLVYASDRTGGENLDIWMKRLPSGEPVRLTNHATDDNQPDISSDGRLIAFHSGRDGGGVYVIPVSGGEAKLIAKNGLHPRFSPDGRLLAYWVRVSNAAMPNGQIYIFDFARGQSRRFRPEFQAASRPVWSPDGQRILFDGYRDDLSTRNWDWWTASVRAATATSTGAKALFEISNLDVGYLPQRIVWSERGIFFSAPPLDPKVREAGNIWRAAISPSTWQLTGRPEQITFGTELEVPSSLRPDGSLVFSVRRATIDLWRIPLSEAGREVGEEPKRLTDDEFEEAEPSISKDGRKLAFMSDRFGGNSDVWLKDFESGGETVVARTNRLLKNSD